MESLHNRIRVAHIIGSLYPGGAERIIVDSVRLADQHEFDVSVCCVIKAGELATDLRERGHEVLVLGKKYHYDLTAIPRLARLLRVKGFDIVHTSTFSGNTWGRAAAVLAGTSCIIAHEQNTSVWKGAHHVMVDRLLARFTDRIIAVSQGVKRFLVEEHRIPAGKIEVVYNGILVDEFRSAADPESIQAELGLVDGGPTIGVVGRLEKQKGHTYLFQAARKVVDHYPRAIFLMVGDGSLRSRLEGQVAELGLSQNVRFLGVRRDVPSILAAADIFALSSLWEGLPLTLCEAMALEKPVIATRLEGVCEVVRDGVTGILVPPADADALADGLLCLIQNQRSAREMGRRGYRLVRDRFDFHQTVRNYERIYREVLGRKRE